MNVSGNRRLLSAICGIFIVIIIFIWGYKKSVDITISAGLATDKKDNIYLAIDRKIYKFDSLGKLLLTVKGGFGPLLKVAVDDQENIYVADATNYQLKRFLANGTLALTVPLASEFRPGRGWDDAFGVTVDNDGNVWVCMATRHRLQKFSPSGQLLLQYPEDKTKLELCYPNEIAFDKDRNAYIANSRGYSIDVLDGNLAFLRSVPARELDGGLYHCPTSICVDSEGHIYVAALDDFYSKGKIYKLDPWGQVLATFSPEDEEGNLLLPSDIAVTDERVFSIDQDRMLFSVFNFSGKKVSMDPESDLVRILSRKRLLMQCFSNAPTALGILGGGLLVLLIVLRLIAAVTSSKLRTTESIQTAREEGFSFHRTVFGLPISIVMWVSLAAVLLSSSGQLKELFLVMSLSRGGFRTMHPGLLSSLSYNLEYTIPFIFAAVAVFLFWKLRYPKCLKFPAILLLIFTLAHFLRMVDPFGVRWLRLIDVPIFYLSAFSIFGVPLTTLATIIVFFIVNRGAIRYRRSAIRLNSEAIEALTGQKKITIPWQKVDRVLEVKWPYRTILVCGHSDSIAFDKFLKERPAQENFGKLYSGNLSRGAGISRWGCLVSGLCPD
jgi:outer membrane protein assembly factor BamB